MTNVHSDTYWTEEFSVTLADMNRLAGFIAEQNQAQDSSSLIKRVIRGRLRYGHDSGETAIVSTVAGSSIIVRLWDPAGVWRSGDHVIVIRKRKSLVFSPFIGEVTAVADDLVQLYLSSENETVRFARAAKGSVNARRWHAKVREVVEQKRAAEGEEEWIDLILLEHGERLTGLLLQALREDENYVLLDGRYFLRSLAVYPKETQLHNLTWSLLGESDPLTASDLLTRIPNAKGDSALFGLYLALRQHPEWFTNTQPGKRPLWKLAGPPPGSFTPQSAAYDPDTYEILCMPEIESSQEIVGRLWETELLADVV